MTAATFFSVWLVVTALVAAVGGARRGPMVGLAAVALCLLLAFWIEDEPLLRLFAAAAAAWAACCSPVASSRVGISTWWRTTFG